MLEDRDGVCTICRQSEVVKRNGRIISLAVDHNHTTGDIRGLLFNECNVTLGVFEKYEGRIGDFLNYLYSKSIES